MKIRLFLLLFPIIFASFLFGKETSPAGPVKESYIYSSRPVSEPAKKSAVFMEILKSDRDVSFTKQSVSADRTEIVEVKMQKDGSFISGFRAFPAKSGSIDRIWRQEDILYYAGPNSNSATKQYQLESGKPFAVDISLLYLLRFFPFSENPVWKVAMADFSNRSITVTIRSVGIEHVRVPAGEFDCYRMEVTVNIPILRPKITYWLASEYPHFLVKHVGKLSAFSKQYVSELEEIGGAVK